MTPRNYDVLPVTITVALWQLMHLGTWLHIVVTNEPKIAEQAKQEAYCKWS